MECLEHDGGIRQSPAVRVLIVPGLLPTLANRTPQASSITTKDSELHDLVTWCSIIDHVRK